MSADIVAILDAVETLESLEKVSQFPIFVSIVSRNLSCDIGADVFSENVGSLRTCHVARILEISEFWNLCRSERRLRKLCVNCKLSTAMNEAGRIQVTLINILVFIN